MSTSHHRPTTSPATPAKAIKAVKPSLWQRFLLLSARRRRIEEVSGLRQFTLLMSTLLDAGADMVTALDEVAWAMRERRPALSAAAQDISRGVRQGRSVATVMAEQEVFPPMLVAMASVGERSGALSRALAKTAYFYDRELDLLYRRPRHCVHAPDSDSGGRPLHG